MSTSGRYSHDGESLADQLRAERSRAARLAAELVLEREKVRQLEDAYNHKDNEAWHQHATIETLKVELHNIATLTAQLQAHMLVPPATPVALPASDPQPAGDPGARAPLSAAAQEADLGLKVALMDLEDRLQQAVALVLDELNTRKAAEARIRELETQLATVRRRIAGAQTES